MTTLIKAAQAIRSYGNAFQPALRSWPAYIGDGSGNVISDTDIRRYYCRYPSQESPAVEVYAAGCPPVDGLRVMVGYSADQPKLVRVLSWNDPALDNATTPLQYHADQHAYLAGDTVWVDWRQITTLKVQPYSGLSVYVNGGVLPRSGVDTYVQPQIVDLSGSVPNTANQGRYALISLDPDGVVEITNGTLVTPYTALDIDSVPSTPAGNFRLAAVQLAYGQTSIDENTSRGDILDLRWPQEKVAGTDTAITALTGDVTATGPGSVSATLATVNASPGTYAYATVTVNAKGLVTAASAGTTPTTGSGTSGRVTEWTGTNTIGSSTLIKSGAGVLTLSAAGTYTLTVPKTGTVPVGTGTAGRIAEWVTDTNTLQASTLVKSGAGVLTLSSSGAFTLTVPATGTVALGTGANTRVTFWSGTNSLSSSANLVWDNASNLLGIGATPFAVLTVVGTGGQIYLASSAAGSVNKVSSLVSGRYTSGLVAMLSADIQSASHVLNFGGGMGGNYAATLVKFLTAADVNTTTGTVAMSIDANQNVGIGIDPAAYRLHALVNNATTNASDTVVCFGHNSTGTAAAGFGLTHLYTLESSTTADTSAAAWDVTWATATHASRKARIAGKVYDTAARTWLQVDTDGASSDVLINSLIYGSMYMDDGAQAVTATLANTYYEVGGGMTGSLTNGTTFQNSKELLITVAGTYEVDWSMSISNSVSDNTVAGAVMVNSTEKHTTENATRAKETGVTYSMGGTGIIALAVNDVVKLCVENETAAGSTITVDHANLKIVRIGE